MSVVGRDAIDIRRMTDSDLDRVIDLIKKITKGKSRITYRDLVANNPGGPLDMSLVVRLGVRWLALLWLVWNLYMYHFWKFVLFRLSASTPSIKATALALP